MEARKLLSSYMQDQELDLQDLLDSGLVVTLRINMEAEGLEIPDSFKTKYRSFHFMGEDYNFNDFDIGGDLDTPGLTLTQDGIHCTLFFGEEHEIPFECFFPYSSVIGYGGPAVDKAREDFGPTLTSIQGGGTGAAPEVKRERPAWLRVIK